MMIRDSFINNTLTQGATNEVPLMIHLICLLSTINNPLMFLYTFIAFNNWIWNKMKKY